jgi:hypothetical protein
MSLPQNLNFNNSVEASASRSFRSNIQPQTGTTFKKGETIIFNIPTRQNLVMSGSESMLKGRVTFKNGAGASDYLRFDSNGAHGLIFKLQVYHGSNLLETIENYNTLSKMLFDLQVSTPQANGKYSVLAGTSTEYASAVIAQNATANGSDLTTTQALANSLKTSFNALRNSSKYINTGRRLNNYGTAIAIDGTVSLDFSIPLISIIGSLSPKFIPLFTMKSAPLRLELTLVTDPLQAICSHVALATDGNDMVVDQIEFVASMMELSDSAISIINSNTGGRPLQYTFQDWRNYRWASAVPDAVTNLSMPIPAKYASLKALFIASKRTNTSGAVTFNPFPAEKAFLNQYQFRIGAELYPSKPPQFVSEFFSETLKAIGSISDPLHAPAIDYDSYNVDVQTLTNETLYSAPSKGSPSFYVGLDLESYAGSDKSQLFSGKFTANDDIYYNPILNAHGVAAGVTLVFDAFAHFDSVIVFENDTAYVKY